MKVKRFSEELIIGVLKEAESGARQDPYSVLKTQSDWMLPAIAKLSDARRRRGV